MLNLSSRIIVGDVLKGLASIDSESVDVCITSPPYWQLRDYRVNGQIGLEESPAAYLDTMVGVFEEVRRVLRKDGTCWMNMGDSYAGARRGGDSNGRRTLQGGKANQEQSRGVTPSRRRDKEPSPRADYRVPNLKPKDMVGMPWRLAFALQESGWYLRQEIIWHKPNAMPESARDRCTKAHEHLFLLTKSRRYYYNAEAIEEPASENTHLRVSQDVANQRGSTRANGGLKHNGPMKAVMKKTPANWIVGEGSHRNQLEGGASRVPGVNPKAAATDPGDHTGTIPRANADWSAAMAQVVPNVNKRSVWTIPTSGYKGAHFATFPEALVEPPILAGSRPGGVVLDPFAGSGTVGAVAIRLGRSFIGCELNPEYAAMAEKRIARVQPPLFASVLASNKKRRRR